jgi:hypothetical protein
VTDEQIEPEAGSREGYLHGIAKVGDRRIVLLDAPGARRRRCRDRARSSGHELATAYIRAYSVSMPAVRQLLQGILTLRRK